MKRRAPLSSKYLILLAAIVGVISGLGAFIFYFLLDLFTKIFLSGLDSFNPPLAGGEAEVVKIELHLGILPLPVVVALGGLLSGLIVYKFAPEAEGHGTDAVIRAFHRARGEIRARVPIVKTIASAITIGSGGSAGREGPIAQIGAGFGSFVGELLRLSDKDRRILVICGVAGGIGSIFRSPFGGAMFGIEVLYKRDNEVEAIVPAFVSSIVAFIVFDVIMSYFANTPFGVLPIFKIPQVTIHSPLEFPIYAIVSVLAAFFGIIYVKVFYTVHNYSKRVSIPPYFKPAIGGFFTGVIGLFLPGVLGMGYGYVQMAIDGKLAVTVMLLLIFGKIVATSLTVGTGGSGGVFAPSIVIGSMVGGFVGYSFHYLFPNVIVQPEAFVLIGMSAFVAAVAKTPIAAILMVLEMCGGYSLLPALMTAATLAYYLAGDYSIYAEQVATRAESPAHRMEMSIDVLENVRVQDAMVSADKLVVVTPYQRVSEVLELIEKTGHMGFPVVMDGRLVGMVTFEDVERVPLEERDKKLVRDIMTRELIVTYPDETLEEALIKLVDKGIGRLPVVDRNDEKKLLGIITRSDIMKAHAREVKRIVS
ncbi:chloride channel protein [Archaeoglobus fulgidus]|uniref:Chloride channel, putative n=2 Tax=Archaeoglobus fulgidus TaxID=2234 RepID=O28857_ARCFU|nr:chloride channel protein [Archaeoglobus fulgidus]AAB89832.1 chloride channel, putative [Archaeoglobus fulgidus DSM 4304]AIG98295.1 Chloride channel protein EriC [Archaeoglobus fulgidus DSM 8774]